MSTPVKKGAPPRSADWQSAVSRIGNPQTLERIRTAADCQSAIQQAVSLRYLDNNFESAP
jgi:hypothetical protein